MARQRRQSLGVVGARTAATHSADEHITSEPAFIAAPPLSEGGADLPRQPISGAAIPTATRIWRAAGGHTDARSKGMPRAAARAPAQPLLRPLFRRAGSGAACATISRRRCLPGHSRPASTCSIPAGCALVQVRRWHTLECGARTSSEGRSRGGTEHEEVQTTRRMVAGGAGAGAGAGVSIYAFVCCVRVHRRACSRVRICSHVCMSS